MSDFIRTKKAAFLYLIGVKDAIFDNMRDSSDLNCMEAAHVLALAGNTLQEIVHYLAMTIDQEKSKEE